MNEYLHPKNLNLVQLPTDMDTTIAGLRNPYLPKKKDERIKEVKKPHRTLIR